MKTEDIIAFIICTLMAGIFGPMLGKWWLKFWEKRKKKKEKKENNTL